MNTDRIAPCGSSSQEGLPGFGARLRVLRRACNFKQAHIAQMAGVNQATISRWESGVATPSPDLANAILKLIHPADLNDSTLRRLVESSTLTAHLVTDADHILLAASPKRQAEWGVSIQSLLGKTVWAAASPAIQLAESNLESLGWWETMYPEPVSVELTEYDSGFLPIVPGRMLWERVWLADGRPARLCTLLQ